MIEVYIFPKSSYSKLQNGKKKMFNIICIQEWKSSFLDLSDLSLFNKNSWHKILTKNILKIPSLTSTFFSKNFDKFICIARN